MTITNCKTCLVGSQWKNRLLVQIETGACIYEVGEVTLIGYRHVTPDGVAVAENV